MSGGPYEIGNVIRCPFAFLARDLTPDELGVFLTGGGLPSMVGVDPPGAVFFDYRIDGGAITTISGGGVLHDAVGAFHVDLPVDTPGLWTYKGRADDLAGNPLVATLPGSFVVEGF